MEQVFRIAGMREHAGLTQAELAKRMGCGQSAVGMWETGARAPKSRILPKLAEVLGCSIEELYARKST